MKFILTSLAVCIAAVAMGQLEISTGAAVNKHDAVGPVIHLAYEFKIKNRFYTKSQLGYKYLHTYNDFVEATLKSTTWEIHQTLSYELVRKKKYILKPNVGINYRFYVWKGKMKPPYNELPQRVWLIDLREGRLILNSFDGEHSNSASSSNFGFSFQLQNQFFISEKIWLHVTPFIEPDYDRIQNMGGFYIGVVKLFR